MDNSFEFSRREFIGSFGAFSFLGFGGGNEVNQFNGVAPFENYDGTASDSVFVRRAYLDLAGRIPTMKEAKEYVESIDPKKKEKLIDSLLASETFIDYWTLRFADILRVKSEFPINLWPNAVYVYWRRIREFVKSDEQWDKFARALLTSKGSNFRDAESNFFRAVSQRTPEGITEAVMQTFLGVKYSELDDDDKKEFAEYFANVRVKNTREWKEEIVWIDGEDKRADFCDMMLDDYEDEFASSFVSRVLHWFYGSPAPEEGEKSGARRDKNFVKVFKKNGYRLKPLLREIALSREYAQGCVTGGFPLRRMDAEVLEDAICDLTGTTRDYQSIAPEPFTFLPPERRSINIEDGSITSAFLLLFGRPARDSGLPDERRNDVTAKQRLFLFNSGKLFSKIGKITNNKKFSNRGIEPKIDDLYWSFLSRAPLAEEKKMLVDKFNKLKGRQRWRFPHDLAWCLLNSKEFIFRH